MIMSLFAAVQNVLIETAAVSHYQFVTDIARCLLADFETEFKDTLSSPPGGGMSDVSYLKLEPM